MRLQLAINLALSLAVAAGCKGKSGGHSHSSDHPSGHDHHAEGHGHDSPTVSLTRWSEKYELFAEHTAGTAGQELSFLLHLTELEGFAALTHPDVSMVITGPTQTPNSPLKQVAPGIFAASIRLANAGPHTAALFIDGKNAVEFKIEVAPPGTELAENQEDDGGLIEFLKEQQWSVPFATEFVKTGVLVASVEVSGRIQTPPGGRAEVSAPIAGRLLAPKTGLPWPGTDVTQGQVLAQLQPAPSSPEEGARASLAVAEAQARASAAKAELERSQRLLKDDAIAKRDVEAAERENRVAQEAVRAASRAQRLFAGSAGKSGQGAWRLTAPISGTLVSVHATPGATVSPGEALFEIVDARELWILARVPEQDAARLRSDRDASFQLTGQDTWQPIHIMGDDATAALVTIGKVVDAQSRTVDVLYSLQKPDSSLRVGGLAQVSVPAGEEFVGLVIPRTALVQQGGRDIVYVQIDGEHFEERSVRVMASAGKRIGISGALKEGERLVTRGAHLVRLAESASGPAAHGHIH